MKTANIQNPLEINKPDLVFNLEDCVGEAVSIIIVHKDRPAYLSLCLQSIAVFSRNHSYEIIVVDNASGPETQAFLDEIQTQVKVVRNPKNLYWSEAANLGVQASDPRSKYFIFMHSDVMILNPAWIDTFINVAEANKSGMVGLQMGSYQMGNQKVDFIHEWCVLISREGYNKIAPWPNNLPLLGHAFVMTVKAQLAGLRPQVMQNNVAHHCAIFGVDVNDYEELKEKAYKVLPKVYQQVHARSL